MFIIWQTPWKYSDFITINHMNHTNVAVLNWGTNNIINPKKVFPLKSIFLVYLVV